MNILKSVRVHLLVLLGLSALLETGCSGKRAQKQVFPVQGRVTYRGRPIPDALIVLHPLEDADPHAVRPAGRVQPDGTFRLTTYEPDDGAPAGNYAITVVWRKSPRSRNLLGVEPDSRQDPVFPDFFSGYYSDPTRSGLKVTIQPGITELPLLALN